MGPASFPKQEGQPVQLLAMIIQQSGLKLETLAQLKKISIGILNREGWRTASYKGLMGVAIPWYDIDGPGFTAVGYHFRFRIPKEGPGSRWAWDCKRTADLIPYGAWHAQEAIRSAVAAGRTPTVAVVESELDAVTLWLGGVFAVAAGGADFWHPAWASFLAPFEKIYVAAEPDGAGVLFASRVTQDLLGATPSGFDVRVLTFPQATKDASALWLAQGANRKAFTAAIEELLEAATIGTEWAEAHRQLSWENKRPSGRVTARPRPELLDALYAHIESLGRAPRPLPNGDFRARCPIPGHEDLNPSFDFGLRGYHCRSRCGSGGLLDLARRLGLPGRIKHRRPRLAHGAVRADGWEVQI